MRFLKGMLGDVDIDVDRIVDVMEKKKRGGGGSSFRNVHLET